MIHVALVEDDAEIRDSMELFLSRTGDISVVGSYSNAEQFEADFNAIKDKLDVVLMDIGLPGIGGIACVRKMKPLQPEIQYMMCTVHNDPVRTFESLCAGATGYILKNIIPRKLKEAILDIYQGGSPMSASIARFVVNSYTDRHNRSDLFNALTPREQETIVALSKGYQYKEIADQLGISIETVRSYLRRIYEKLHVHSKVDAINKVFNRIT